MNQRTRSTHDLATFRQLEERYGAFSTEQREILRAIQLQGFIGVETAEKYGWTWRHGLPREALRDLITRKVVAPRIITSQPLRVSWELRMNAGHAATLAQVEREASRLRYKEHAEGGFRIDLRRELRGKRL